jgi:hypothetical protein
VGEILENSAKYRGVAIKYYTKFWKKCRYYPIQDIDMNINIDRDRHGYE